MAEFFLWIVILCLFILSFVGLIFPLIPSSIAIWIGFIIYHFAINGAKLSLFFWISMIIFTVILMISDILVNSYFVKKFGGSKWGERGAAIAVIVGSFIVPPFGIIFIPILTVITIELIQKQTAEKAILASFGSLIGFFSSVVAKIFIQLLMISWFFMTIIF